MRLPYRAGKAKFIQLALWCLCVAGLQSQHPNDVRDSSQSARAQHPFQGDEQPTSHDPLAFQHPAVQQDDRR